MTFPVRSLVGRPARVIRDLGSSPRRTALAIALLFGVSSVFTFAAPSETFAWGNNSFSSSSAAALVSLTNRSRASAGLKALKVDSRLASVARWRSKDMIERDYFSHSIPGYGKVWDKLHAIDYCYKVGGENIGWNNYPDDVATSGIHKMFMDSSGHRSNILGKAWDVIGIGAYKGPTGKKMWTVLFADKCGSTAPKPTAKPTPKPTRKPTAKPTTRPKATARPTARPTAKPVKATPEPEPTPTLDIGPTPEPTPPIASDDLITPSNEPETEPSEEPEVDASDEPGVDGEPGVEGAVGMRVVDRTSTDGLLSAIVGGVTGFFFGG